MSIITENGNTETAEIDTLLMSCRIIGRKIEYTFMDHVIGKTKEKKINTLKAKYIKTQKNEQVKEFYDKCLFDLVDENESVREYSLETKNYETKNLNYIEVINE